MPDEVNVSGSIAWKGRPRRIEADRLMAELARSQHGIVSRGQLLSKGVSVNQIEGRLRRAQIHRIHRGVYAVGHSKLTIEGEWMAAVLAGGPDAVLCGRSAAQLWGLMDRSRSHPEVRHPGKQRAKPGIDGRGGRLLADETTLIEGIPTTTMPRTLFELAAVLELPQLERVFNEAEVQRLTDRLSLPDLLARHPRHRGNRQLRLLLADPGALAGVTKHELEARFKEFIDATGLPRPRFNAGLAVAGRFFDVDCLWRRERLVVELDGHSTHGTRRAFERDRERDRALMLDGWRVTRVTWRALHDRRADLAADLRALLATSPGATPAIPTSTLDR